MAGVSDENDADQLVQQLRDRVRSQALDLLNRVEASRPTPGGASRKLNEEKKDDLVHEIKSPNAVGDDDDDGDDDEHTEGEYSHGDDGGDDDDDDARPTPDNTNRDDEDRVHLTPAMARSAADKVLRRGSSALTQRLQKLALDREETRNDQRQRLRVIQSDATSHLSSCKSFQELQLPDHLLKAIFEMGLDRPSAIQEEALPRILKGRNLFGQAKSGSGKTVAFSLGLLYHCVVDTPANVQGLVLTPTRELAIQIVEIALQPMSAYMKGLKIKLAISGEQVEKGKPIDAHIIVGTPGKVVTWFKQKVINPKTIKTFVMDEADTMVDVGGFRANSLLIKKQLPKACQYLLFSATFPPLVVDFASKMIGNADKILIEQEDSLVVDVIKQLWIDTRNYPGGKIMFLADIYNLMTIGQSIIFVETRTEADSVHATLSGAGYTCSVLHSGLEPEDRDSTMECFRKGESTVLITTNVLARGVDVDNVCLVICCHVQLDKDGQPDYETYLHRIGRTGRFGRKGTAITLVSDQKNEDALRKIEVHFASPGQTKPMIQQAESDPEKLADTIEI